MIPEKSAKLSSAMRRIASGATPQSPPGALGAEKNRGGEAMAYVPTHRLDLLRVDRPLIKLMLRYIFLIGFFILDLNLLFRSRSRSDQDRELVQEQYTHAFAERSNMTTGRRSGHHGMTALNQPNMIQVRFSSHALFTEIALSRSNPRAPELPQRSRWFSRFARALHRDCALST